ncbi:MAG: amino acid ABC transporter substrate-binding protein [Lachnospiraceae bacterium]|nr:amino acid ABC transporter substrate-binding protein [Lachnospiraceae bacterium]
MKKWIAMTLVASMTAALLTACGGSETAATAETESAAPAAAETESSAETESAEAVGAEDAEGGKTFTVGFDAEFPPYGYKDDAGEYVGFDLDLARAVCEKNGWEFVAQPIDWDAKDMELSSGAIDCIWNGFTMNGREDDYTWSVPYIDNSQVFVVPADGGIASKEDLAGKVVGVQKDSSALAALTDEENQENLDLAASFADLVEYADYNTAFMDLEAGAIEALAIDIGVASYQIESRGDGYVMLEEPLSTEQYGIGFLKGNDELKDTVEKSLLELYEEGVVDKTAEEYGIDSSMICLGK